MIGKSLSHYKILEELGRGGMGIVYKAEDTKLDRTVAIKVLPSAALASEDDRARFYREAKAAAQLNHPNIATVYEINEAEDGQAFIAMEYVDGRDLKSHVSEGPFSSEVVMDYATQIAMGLQEAHEKGIVHRDIKNANIMLTRTGRIKILDFGLAKLAGQVKISKTGSTLGTAAYMSPEQARGSPVTEKSDLFSFGVVLYELLTGHLPFAGEYEAAVAYSILNAEPLPIATYASHDAGWQPIIDRSLKKDADARYQSANAMLAAIKALSNGGGKGSSGNEVIARKPHLTKSLGIAGVVGILVLLFLFVGDGNIRRYLNSFGSDNGMSEPLVLMMDSHHERRVYDEETIAAGGTNADVVSDILLDLPIKRQKEAVGVGWHRDEDMLNFRPNLIIIHYSAFRQWDGEGPRQRLLLLLEFFAESDTKFLIYSRRDADVLRYAVEELILDLDQQHQGFAERVHTFALEESGVFTFRDPAVAARLKLRVKAILELE